MVNPSAGSRPAFSLIEILVSIGVVFILLGLLLPALGRARGKAIDTVCLAEMRQLATRVTLYATDSDDFVPFIYTRDPATGRWTTPSGIGLEPEFFSTAADFWAGPMLDEFGGSFISERLLCINDNATRATAEWASQKTGTPVERVGVPLVRAISRSFYIRPESLRKDRTGHSEIDNRVAKLADVFYPSRKAFLIEGLPFHEPAFVGPSIPTDLLPYRLMVAAADTSVAWRSNGDALPGVLIHDPAPPGPTPLDPSETERIMRLLAAFDSTRGGVHGRDW